MLNGEAGLDTVLGEAGADTITGGDNDDKLDGGAGTDVVKGDAGEDVVIGGAQNDQLWGGTGNDLFVFRQADGAGYDQIFDWDVGLTNQWAKDEGDKIVLCGQSEQYWAATKIAFGNWDDDLDFSANDVTITLSDNQIIRIYNAADDFTAGVASQLGVLDMFTVGNNTDDVVRKEAGDLACYPSCDVPAVSVPGYAEPVWDTTEPGWILLTA